MGKADHLRKAISAARHAREELGLGQDQPLHDVLKVVEETARVPVAVLALDEGLAGAYIRRRDRPFIFVNGSQAVTRQRFTLGHELGHHRLGHVAVVDGVENVGGASRDPQEQQANMFAGEFLAPDRGLRAWMEAHGSPELELPTVIAIADWFGISTPAAKVRLEQAGILQRPKQKAELQSAISRGHHRAIERARDVERVQDSLARIASAGELPRLPAQLRDNALASYAAGLIDLARLAEVLRRDSDSVQSMVHELGIRPAEPVPDW